LIAISIFFSYRCEMATKDQAKKFAAQAILVDSVLVAQGVSGNAGRVVFILDAANKTGGGTQKDILEETNLPKDVVSKLVGSLVSSRLLTRERATENSRIKRLNTTERGRKLLSRVTAALQPPPRKQEFGPVRKVERLSLF
jgi:DNA-binding MarR family transcriptional regulator